MKSSINVFNRTRCNDGAMFSYCGPRRLKWRWADGFVEFYLHLPSVDTCAQTRLHEHCAGEAVLKVGGSATAAIRRECSRGAREEVT